MTSAIFRIPGCWFNRKLEAYATLVDRRIALGLHFRDTPLPRNAMGKVVKTEIRQFFSQGNIG